MNGENSFQPGTPESFNVLVKELQSLGLDVIIEKSAGAMTEKPSKKSKDTEKQGEK